MRLIFIIHNPLSVTLHKVGERILHWGVPASVLYPHFNHCSRLLLIKRVCGEGRVFRKGRDKKIESIALAWDEHYIAILHMRVFNC